MSYLNNMINNILKKIFSSLFLFFIIFFFLLFPFNKVMALPVGTLLYRTSSDGKMYGLNEDNLIDIDKGIVKGIYCGHAAVYVGKENGEDYIVEALAGGLQKTPAKYFIDKSKGEKFVGAKIPSKATYIEKYKAAQIALALAEHNFSYDLDFKNQKGPGDNQWTCVGLTEKVYESSNIFNPYSLKDLVYDQNNYGVDITPDGYDDYSIINKRGDVFSKFYEFSLIKPYTEMIFPAPEVFGFDAGREHDGKRYFFLPYTQCSQDNLEDVEVDIQISSDYIKEGVRTEASQLRVALKWGIINQPISSIKKVANYIGDQIDIFLKNNKKEKEIVFLEDEFLDKDNLEEEAKDNIKTTVLENVSDFVQQDKKDNYYFDNSFSDEEDNNLNKDDKVEQFFVQKVLGGDSVLLDNGSIVKYLGIKAPNLKGFLTKEDECLSWVANKRNEEIILGKEIFLEKDDNFDIDNRNRLLRYVYFKDGKSLKFINEILLKEGLAFLENEYLDNEKILKIFKNANEYARQEKLGLYSGVCDENKFLVNSNLEKEKVKDIVNNLRVNDKNSVFNFNNLNKDTFFEKNNKSGELNYIINGGINEENFNNFSVNNNEKNNRVLSINERISDNILFKTIENDLRDNVDNSNNNFNIGDDNNSENFNTDNNENNSNNIDDEGSNNNDSSGEDSFENIEDNDNQDEVSTSTEEVILENSCVNDLIISRIYSTGNNDWIEIFNPCDKVVDLGLESIRLEKSKTAIDPSILIRFSDEDDYILNTSLNVNPNSYFLITSSEADDEIKNEADVISLRNEFTWRGDGYSIYLARGPVSDSSDADIIDLVGFGGDSLYFEGFSPAVAIDDNSILTRKASESSTIETLKNGNESDQYLSYDSDNNYFDFLLWPLIIENNNNESENDDDEGNNDNQNEQGDGGSENNFLFSDKILNLWHFSECRLNTIYDSLDSSCFNNNFSWNWSVGDNDCALTANQYNNDLSLNLNSDFSLYNFKFFWKQKLINESSRLVIKFVGEETDSLEITFCKFYIEIKMPDKYKERFPNINCSDDGLWHDMVLSVNPDSLLLKIYEDDILIHEQEVNQRLVNFSNLKFLAENDYSSVDEVAIFDGSLDIEDLLNANRPFKPLGLKAKNED